MGVEDLPEVFSRFVNHAFRTTMQLTITQLNGMLDLNLRNINYV